jgi:hypothetical protein
MEKRDWVEHCNAVTRLLQRVREEAPNLLKPDERKFFDEALDANELGIAFDFLCDKFDEAGRPLPPAVLDLLMIAGNKMQ